MTVSLRCSLFVADTSAKTMPDREKQTFRYFATLFDLDTRGKPEYDRKKHSPLGECFFVIGDPSENRTRVTAVRGRCPRPLDDGTLSLIVT